MGGNGTGADKESKRNEPNYPYITFSLLNCIVRLFALKDALKSVSSDIPR
jgi:hypothetical protein